MKIYDYDPLVGIVQSGRLWAEARDYADRFSYCQLERLEEILENAYPDGMDITTLNDLFRFDTEMAASWAGMSIQEFEAKFWKVDDSNKWKWEEDESN